MKKLCVLLLTVLTVTLGALAQSATDVSGIVLSAEENEPVVGATVMVRGTNVGTMTDVDGKFRLKAPAGSKTLIVSYVGMHTQEVAVAPTVRVLLENDAQALDEVIVTVTTQPVAQRLPEPPRLSTVTLSTVSLT